MYDSTVSEHKPLRVLVYSDDKDVRSTVLTALGARPHPDLPPFEYVECATEPVVMQQLDEGRIDLVINTPTGGGARSDGQEIRGAAVRGNIPCITTMTGASAAVRAITAGNGDGPSAGPLSLQELHQGVS